MRFFKREARDEESLRLEDASAATDAGPFDITPAELFALSEVGNRVSISTLVL